MTKRHYQYLFYLLTMFFFAAASSCGGNEKSQPQTAEEELAEDDAVSLCTQSVRFIDKPIDKEKSFVVISKKELSLSVYAVEGTDTLLAVRYPVCISKNKGQKQESGDMRTPESEPGEPFTITEIKDASTWVHDFNDGKGEHLAYGHWFLRLSYGRGIGIHGSTGNEWSIPGSKEETPKGKTVGRDSEGCIRLNDADIIDLHDRYAYVGMRVIIKTEEQGALPFERNLKNKGTKGKPLTVASDEPKQMSAPSSKDSELCGSDEI